MNEEQLPAQYRRVLAQLQAQLEELRRRQDEVLSAHEAHRRRLDAAMVRLERRLDAAEGTALNVRDLGDVRRQFAALEHRLVNLGHEVLVLRNGSEKQAQEVRTLGTEIRARPIWEPAYWADQIGTLVRRADAEKARFSDELKRLQERVHQLGGEWTRAYAERDARVREELAQRANTLQATLNSELEKRVELGRELLRKGEEREHSQHKQLDELRALVQEEGRKQRERNARVNEALHKLERHLEGGNRKVDRLIGAELDSRKAHEKALLDKMADAEVLLNNQLNELTRSVGEVRAGLGAIRIPVLDTDALRRDMEAIATEKNKLSIEGLLRLEERVARMHHAIHRDRRELRATLAKAVGREVSAQLRAQIQRLDELFGQFERTQQELREQVEHKIPDNLQELSAKLDNFRAQLVHRVDQEEEERYLAIRELQDAYGKLASGGTGAADDTSVSSATLKRDVDECKVAIKKLAESLTTVRNVLDRKIMEEVRRREQDSEVLNSRIDAATMQAMQIQ